MLGVAVFEQKAIAFCFKLGRAFPSKDFYFAAAGCFILEKWFATK